METHALLSKYTSYNLWANQAMATWLLSKDEYLMSKEVLSSFSTISETLVHIWFAEHLWLQRLQNLPFSNIKERVKGQHTAFIADGMLNESRLFRDYTEGLKTSDLDCMICYSLLTPEMLEERSVWMIIQHTINHSTYHRGQLVTMGRELGFIDPPKTDFIQYFRDKV